MKLTFSFQVLRSRFTLRIKSAQVNGLAIYSDLGREFVSSLAHSQGQSLATGGLSQVLHIDGLGR